MSAAGISGGGEAGYTDGGYEEYDAGDATGVARGAVG